MLTIYFCLDGQDPIIRCWSAIPRIGDTVALSELEDEGESFKVTDVVWEGDDEPSVSIYIKSAEGLLRRFVKKSGARTPCNGHPDS